MKRLNLGDRVLDFGAVATNGAFRLAFAGDEWELIPLPASRSFKVELRLDRLEASGREVESVTALDSDRQQLGPIKFQQTGGTLAFETDLEPFAYRIRLR